MTKKIKMGRPTKYRPEYCEKIIEHMKHGKSLNSFAASIGSHRQILYVWMEKHPNFKDACDVAQAMSQEWWEEFAMQAATGRIFDKTHEGKYDKHNPNMIQFMMSRRFKDFYQKKNTDEKENADSNNEVNLTVNLNSDELKDEIDRRIERRKRRKTRKTSKT